MKTLIPVHLQEKYSDNLGAFDIVMYYDTLENSFETRVFSEYNRSEKTPEIDFNFLRKNENKLKDLIIDKILEYEKFICWGVSLGEGLYNITVNIKGSRKYKGKTAKLVEVISSRDYNYKEVFTAKIQGLDGSIYEISPSCVTVPNEEMRSFLNRMTFDRLTRLEIDADKFYFI